MLKHFVSVRISIFKGIIGGGIGIREGMSNCCLKSVPQSDSSFETFAAPVADWAARLTAGLTRSVRVRGQTPGHLEAEILQQTRGLERNLLKEAAQQKADQSPPVCPVCGRLNR